MLARVLLAVYAAAVIVCYPRRHRHRFEGDMVELFDDLLRRARARSGAAGELAQAARTFVELPRSAWAAHRSRPVGSRRSRHSKRIGEGTMGTWTETFVQDIRFALRSLSRRPGFAALAVLSLGLGVGANTSMFSMIHATLWSSMPVPDADELVRVNEFRESAAQVAAGNFRDVTERSDVFAGTYLHRMETLGLVSDELSRVAQGEIVTAGYFDVLELRPRLGRFFDASQHRGPDAPPEVVISHILWTEMFGGAPGAVGTTLEINEHPFTVIGVAPEDFHGSRFGLSLDVWVPMGAWSRVDAWTEGWQDVRTAGSADMFARLADGVTLDGANAALETLSGRLAEAHPEANAGMVLRASPQVLGQIAPGDEAIPRMIAILAVMGSGLVLLVACGNVASLLMARAVARRREIGMRIALGAGRGRLLRQLLTESFVLAVAGALAGLGLAEWAARVNGRLLPDIPYRFSLDTSPDGTVVGFAVVVSLAAVLVFGLAPAVQATGRDGPAGVLRGDDGGGGLRVRGARLLDAVVVGMVSLSFVTLFLAGLFATSLGYVQRIDPGFATEARAIATLDFGLAGMSATDAGGRYDELLAAVTGAPGVSRAALASPIPIGDFMSLRRTFAADREYAPEERGLETWYSAATVEWLDVAGLELVAGRWFGSRDDGEAPRVAVVNQALADVLWPDEPAVGRRLRTTRDPGGTEHEVVGVVSTGRYLSMIEEPVPALYASLDQAPWSVVVLMAESTGDASSLPAALRDAVRALDPALVPYDIKTMADHLANAHWLFRVGAELGLAVGVLAVILAVAGVYGIMVFRVGQRRREMGIRIALGAGSARVLRHVLAGSSRLVGLGLVIGGAAAAAAAGVVRSIVFGVEAGGAVHLAAVAVVLTALALAATLAPAMSAVRADPVEAIKVE